MRQLPVDKNMIFVNKLNIEDLVYHDFLSEPFRVYGHFRENGENIRLPRAVAEATNADVFDMYKTSTGGRLRFVSDSPYVAVRFAFSRGERIPVMTQIGTIGFDLYADGEYAGTFVPPMEGDAYESVVRFSEAKKRSLMIHFPLYANIESLEIGLAKDSALLPAEDYAIEKPIVFYGSSITNGACASRPGMAYPAQVGRMLDANHYNLGFGGCARGEQAMAEYVASLEMSAFVLDYDHNAYDPDYLLATHEPFFKTVREKNPQLPILMMSAPIVKRNASWQRRYEIIKRTYENALAAGDKNVYFIHGMELLEMCNGDGTVDGTHPNDLGFFSMYTRIAKELEKAFNKK